MTSPPPADQRAALAQVTAAAVATLNRLWRQVNVADPIAARDLLRQIVSDLTSQYGAAAGTLATDVYAILRDAVGPAEDFTPTLGDGPSVSTINKTIGWSIKPLFREEPDPDLALQLLSGGLQKLVADEYRDTIQTAAIDDPAAQGWQRVARPGACPFCDMLAGRGTVYTEQTADFGAHRNCHCLAVPAFTGEAKPVREYTPTNRNITPADRARLARWIAEH